MSDEVTRFRVIDKLTGQVVNWDALSREDWVRANLIEIGLLGFAITEWGDLILLDNCGRWSICPQDRFTVMEVKEEKKDMLLRLAPNMAGRATIREETRRIVKTAVEALAGFGCGEEEALLMIDEEAIRMLMEVYDDPPEAPASAR